jgi:hypothetical protein
MKTRKSYFVHFATCSDGIMRDVIAFDRLSDAKHFTASLAFKWHIEKRIDSDFTTLESVVVAHAIDPNTKYQAMAQKAARRLARFTA